MSNLPKRLALYSVIIPSIILLGSYSLTNTNNRADAEPSNDGLLLSCHCVAFRLDDVQDYPYSSPLIEVMELFREKNIPLTVGVVGNNIDTENKQVYYYIKQRLLNNISPIGDNTTVIEIANHSWEHERFLNFTFQEQYYSIRKTNEKIKSSFGISPTLFIPPSNEFNNDTLLAMHKNNMTIISADERDATAYSTYPNNTIYHIPETAETGNCRICSGSNFSWYGIQSEETMNQIKKSINLRGFAVVVMHPMEYSLEHDDPIFQNSLDLNQVRELKLLIYKIQHEGFQIVTIVNIKNDVGKS